jgi:hypothetical protein
MLEGLFFEDFPLVGGCLILVIYFWVMFHLIREARP